MNKEYMIGTLADYPLLKVTLSGVKYFVDEKKQEVYLDEKGIPKVKDEHTIKAVLEMLK
jgi:hypothetical protein